MIPFTNEFVMLDVRPVILTGVGILNALERALFVNGTSKTKWGCRNDAAPVTCYYITVTNIYSLFPLSNLIVHFHGLSSTWCTAVSPLTEISRILYLELNSKMNSTPTYLIH